MQYNGKTFEIYSWNLWASSIELESKDGDRIARNYDTRKETEETQEVTREEKYIDEEIQQDENGIDFVAKVVKTKEVTETVKTGKMVKNPNYFDPKSLKEIETWLVKEHGFTK